MIGLILVAVTQVLAMFCVCLFLRHLLNAKQAEIEAKLSDLAHTWADPQPDNKPSKLGEVLGAAGEIMGRSAAKGIMDSLQLDKTHAANVAQGALMQEGAIQNPVLALMSGGKRGKNAGLLRLAELLGPMLGKGNGAAAPVENTASVRSRLERQG